jgi:hypothetical protein
MRVLAITAITDRCSCAGEPPRWEWDRDWAVNANARALTVRAAITEAWAIKTINRQGREERQE